MQRAYILNLYVRHLAICIVALFFAPIAIAAKEYTSIVTWGDAVELAVPVSGFINSIDVRVGELVSKNQKLVSIENPGLPMEIAGLEAKLVVAQIDEKTSLQELERVKSLHESQVWSTSILENAEAKYSRAVASKNDVAAQLNSTKLRLTYLTVTAPFDAVIKQITVQEHELVTNAFYLQKPFITLVRADSLRVKLDLPLEEATSLKHNEIVNVIVDKKNYKGSIWSILTGENDATKTTTVINIPLPRDVSGRYLVGRAAQIRFVKHW